MDNEARTSRDHAIYLLSEHADRAPVAAAQAFAMLAVADELTAMRAGLGGAFHAIAPQLGAWVNEASATGQHGAEDVRRLADALERLMATGRVPVDATLRAAPDMPTPGPPAAIVLTGGADPA